MSKIIVIYPLAQKVLAVAVKGEASDWSAYIDAVPGIWHDLEANDVAKSGAKLAYDVAKVLFPGVDQKYKWRK